MANWKEVTQGKWDVKMKSGVVAFYKSLGET